MSTERNHLAKSFSGRGPRREVWGENWDGVKLEGKVCDELRVKFLNFSEMGVRKLIVYATRIVFLHDFKNPNPSILGRKNNFGPTRRPRRTLLGKV